ncbi:MAG: M28 family peptidase [Bryobacteraceae bacterium]
MISQKNLTFFLLACAGIAAGQDATISGERVRVHTKFLSSDLLEGRGVGVRGGDLATEYIASQFAAAGLKPAGDNGTYFQNVPLVGVGTVAAGAELTATTGGKTVPFRWSDEFVGTSQQQKPETSLDADAIFVGHGIVAPEFQWNDYKDVDVRGKVVVLFTNEPTSSDPAFFGGRALTYYGRWTYKYEQALRQGALGCIIIHTTPTAGYGWEVVRNSWSGEQPFVKLAPGEPALAMAGWVSSEAGERLLGMAGHSVNELLKASESRDFRPMPLGIRIHAALPSQIRELKTRNVAAVAPGSDPVLKSEVVMFTAHWDHFGVGRPVNGDPIYNGAVDNATGCGVLIELARAWAALPHKPRRSALFLAVTAEEGGLRGSEYYGKHPIFPTGKTAADLNFDAFFPYGRLLSVVTSGAERTTLWPVVQQAARRMDLTIKPDPMPEQGSYYRSDHFSLARVGVPSFSVEGGMEFAGKPEGFGKELFEEYNSKHYHQPSDEYHEDWDFSGLEQIARFGFLIGVDAANQDKLPTWRKGDEFLAAREKSGVR